MLHARLDDAYAARSVLATVLVQRLSQGSAPALRSLAKHRQRTLHCIDQFGGAYDRPTIATLPFEFREALALRCYAISHLANFPSRPFPFSFVHANVL
jgi:hypothetical protein